jgi:hypothetical protein
MTGPHAAEHDKAVADLVAKAYPTFQDPFMLDYSIYGLVNQTATHSQP